MDTNWQGRNGFLTNHSYGRLTEENRERAFWQSRAGWRDPPELVDLHKLARGARTWPGVIMGSFHGIVVYGNNDLLGDAP